MMIKTVISIILISIAFWFGLMWLGLGLIGVSAIWLLFSTKLKVILWLKKHRIIMGVITFVAILSIAIGMRVFVLEIFAIPSPSMENTLLVGDKILVSKLSYGPRMPQSMLEIPWLNILYFIFNNPENSTDSENRAYQRLDGTSKIKYGDVIVFNSPNKDKIVFIKRCVGTPGDTLEIKNGVVHLNKTDVDDNIAVKLLYQIWTPNPIKLEKIMDSLELKNDLIYGPDHYSINTNRRAFQEAYTNADSYIDSVRLFDPEFDVFPYHTEHNWTINEYGPLQIPQKGTLVHLTKDNFYTYERIIIEETGDSLRLHNDQITLNNKPIDSYTFSDNYYFMMGDNRSDSGDSRYYGFVPEKNIIGKAEFVLFSFKEGVFRWDRIFKKIQ